MTCTCIQACSEFIIVFHITGGICAARIFFPVVFIYSSGGMCVAHIFPLFFSPAYMTEYMCGAQEDKEKEEEKKED